MSLPVSMNSAYTTMGNVHASTTSMAWREVLACDAGCPHSSGGDAGATSSRGSGGAGGGSAGGDTPPERALPGGFELGARYEGRCEMWTPQGWGRIITV